MELDIHKDIASYDNNSKYIKQVFLYWDKGRQNLTDTMKLSIEVIEKLNPDYHFIFLDETNIDKYFPYRDELYLKSTLKLTPQLFSDLLRIYLVSKYGGIWIDCSVFFSKSFEDLEKMLEEYNLEWFSFFLFNAKNMSCHSLISSFIVSKSNNKDLGKLVILLYNFITKERFTILQPIYYKSEHYVFMNEVHALEERNTYPYYILHYMINECIRTNSINVSNILLCNDIIKSRNDNFFGYIGFNKYNKNIFLEKILDENNCIDTELLNQSKMDNYKKIIIKNILLNNKMN